VTPRVVRWLALLALLLCGCAESFTSRLRVAVKTPPAPGCASQGADVYASARPLAGASVFFGCPAILQPGRVRLGKTNERGEFLYKEWGGINIHDGCDIWVEKEGYEPQQFAVHDVCVRFVNDLAVHCEGVMLTVEMRPAARRR
jgi:hypothetical protein